MNVIKRLTVVTALCGAALNVGGCGSESPFAATSVNGSSIVLQGTVLNFVPSLAASVTASSVGAKGPASSASVAETITVTVVEDPNITTTVASDGSFVLRGLPAGSFTLLFKDAAGKELGTLTFEAVLPNQELTVSVEIVAGSVVLIEEQRNGIGHADVEIQGSIDEITLLDPTGDSLFVINGYDVVVRPGATAIRRDNVGLSVDELAVGDQVHVKGAWLPVESGTDASDQQVLAHSITLQDEDEDADGEKVTICHKKKSTLSIGVSAWPAHMAHGDTLGACR
jgi:hypothetical protein